MRIWHDNSGKGKYGSWYLKHVIVQDVQTKEKFFFICNRWFAVEEDDGQVCYVIIYYTNIIHINTDPCEHEGNREQTTG